MDVPPPVRQAPRPDSKSQQKKLAKRQRVEEMRTQKAQEKKRQAAERPPVVHIHEPGWKVEPKTAEEHERLKKERFDQKWKRREDAAERMRSSPYALAFDLAYTSAMTDRINTTFGWMRKAKQPFQLNLVNYVQNSRVDVELKKLLPIEATWRGLNVHTDPLEKAFPTDKLIYLSPDAPDVLDKVEAGKVYVLGGLVDGTRIKNASLTRAKALGIKAMRIPVHEVMEATRDPVLNLNHVAELLSHQTRTNDWLASWHTMVAAEKIKKFKVRDADDPAKPAAAAPAAAGEKEEVKGEKESEKRDSS